MKPKFSVFARLCSRCREVMLQQGAPQVLVDIYQTAIGPALTSFTDANRAVRQARKRSRKAVKEMERRLAEIDGPFQAARAAVAAIEPETELPATLKSQRTDTDKRDAVSDLMEALDEHTGEVWADNLRLGDFGTMATATIAALDEAIAAASALQNAQSARLAAYEAGWAAFVSYKDVVKGALGSSSKGYQRLRLRKNGSLVDEESDEEEEDNDEEGEGEDDDEPTAPPSEAPPEEVQSVH